MEYGCETCVGACCSRLIKLPLELAEVEFLEEGGTILTPLLPASPDVCWSDRLDGETSADPLEQECIDIAPTLGDEQGYYRLETDCGYREQNGDWQRCTVFDDTRRPQVCHDFEASSPTCHLIRLSRGLTYSGAVIQLAGSPAA